MTDSETQTHGDRHAARHTHEEIDSQTHTQTHRQIHRHTRTHRHIDSDRHTHTQTHRQTHGYAQRCRLTHTETDTEAEVNREAHSSGKGAHVHMLPRCTHGCGAVGRGSSGRALRQEGTPGRAFGCANIPARALEEGYTPDRALGKGGVAPQTGLWGTGVGSLGLWNNGNIQYQGMVQGEITHTGVGGRREGYLWIGIGVREDTPSRAVEQGNSGILKAVVWGKSYWGRAEVGQGSETPQPPTLQSEPRTRRPHFVIPNCPKYRLCSVSCRPGAAATV